MLTAEKMVNWDRGFSSGGDLVVFEGSPPPGRGVIIARFPSLEDAQHFGNSEEYAGIRRLREDVADFGVLVLPVPPIPK